MSTQTSIQVVCKFRPLNDLERSEGGQTCIKLEGDSVIVIVDSVHSSAIG